MTLQTGGSACAATSTRSRFFAYAYSRASSDVLIPSWAPSSSIRRTRGTLMASLMRVVSRLLGRTGSIGRRLGLKARSPSGAYSSSSRCHAAARSSSRSTRLNPTRALGPGGEERVRSCFSGLEGSKPRDEIGKAERFLLPAMAADGKALLALPVPVDDDERDLFQLGGADSLPDRLGRLPNVGPVAGLAQAQRDRLAAVAMSNPDREDPHLDRCEPEREAARVVLDEDAHEALERAEECPVDDHWMVLLVVRAHVREAEADRHLVVELDRSHLPGAPERVGHVQIDLRPVEGPLARRDDVLHLVPFERLFERSLGAIPLLVGAEALLRPCRELRARLQAEQVVEESREVDHRVDLVLDLLLGDEDVCVVLGDVAHPEQAVQRPGELVAVQRRRLRVPDRQVAI